MKPPRSDLNELVHAAFRGKAGVLIRLLNAGADINAVSRNWSPLHAAIAGQRFYCVAILINRGADLSKPYLALTPIAYAIDCAIDFAGQCGVSDVPTDIIRLLLKARADPSPGLKVAKDYNHKPLIQLLEAAVDSD